MEAVLLGGTLLIKKNQKLCSALMDVQMLRRRNEISKLENLNLNRLGCSDFNVSSIFLCRVTVSTLRIVFTEEFLTQYLANQSEAFMLCEFRGRIIKIRISDTTPPAGGEQPSPDAAIEHTQRYG